MSAPGAFKPLSENTFDRLAQASPALLETTMDQLRTLVAVQKTGTALGAAKLLGREQSSVQKQLDTLNRNFGELCGEPLTLKHGRGKDLVFTESGAAMAALASRSLAGWLDEVDECRRRIGGTLTVGTTRYTLVFLAHAAQLVAEEFQRRRVGLQVVHLRTKDLLDKLIGKNADLVVGSVVTTPGTDPRLAAFDILEWRRSGLTLLSNLPADRLPDRPVGAHELPRLPLVLPGSGLITDFLRGWFGAAYRNRLDIVAEIDAAQYGFELLRSGLVRGCMLVTRGIGEAADDGRLSEASGLRAIELVSDLQPNLELLSGVFARKGERASYSTDHPLNMLWDAIKRDSAHWQELTDGRCDKYIHSFV